MSIHIKTEEEIEIMREAGRKLAQVMQEIEKNVAVGANTLELDKLAEELVFRLEAEPAFLGYGEPENPFPATICASINDEVVHGIPHVDRVLREGDILKVDIGLKYKGFYADMARTFPVGEVSEEAKWLIHVAEKCFWKGISELKDGAKLSEYSKAVEKYVFSSGFSVVRNLVGHGIGKELHEEPQVPNYYERGYRDVELKTGMTLALEPMINEGKCETMLGEDEWVFKTADGKLSAHYENTILITEKGVEVLTSL